MAKKPIDLSLAEARRLAVGSQGLLETAHFGSGKQGVLTALEHLGYVQIDTISVVERAHHHVLWSRVPDYAPALLAELQKEGRVFEYWSHAAAFLPMREFRFSLPRKKQFAEGKRYWFRRNRKVMSHVLERIRKEGPLQARDFENPKKGGNWFDWKPTKIALEHLFQEGELMIRERRGFQKVYDLTERVLPSGVDQSFPEPDEMARHLIASGLRAHGIATARELAYLRRGFAGPITSALKEMVEEGTIVPVRVEGLPKESYFADPACLKSLRAAEDGAKIISPFDSFIIQRKRVQKLFGYDYQIECYLPEKKRRFGYYCLPILLSGQPVGRIDAKADRSRAVLEVRSVHLEAKGLKKSEFKIPYRKALGDFAAFNGCKKIEGPNSR